MPEFRPVHGCPGYRVGDDGSVWANPRGDEWFPLRQKIDPYGNPVVKINRNATRQTVLVRGIVLLAFHGPCPEGYEPAHRNGDKQDNHASNLFYRPLGYRRVAGAALIS